jgi:hypothetical protein
MGFSEMNGGGSPNGSKWYSRLFISRKVSNSADALEPPVKVPEKRLELKSPPLVVNYFPSNPSLFRL